MLKNNTLINKILVKLVNFNILCHSKRQFSIKDNNFTLAFTIHKAQT